MYHQANDKQTLIFLKTFITPMGKKAQIDLFLKLNLLGLWFPTVRHDHHHHHHHHHCGLRLHHRHRYRHHQHNSHPCHQRTKVRLWHIPARSPDLNPVENFWGWLRKELRRRDLADMVNRRPVLNKMAYRARDREVCRSAKAKHVAKNLAGGLRKVCKEVIEKEGAATRG